MSHDENHPEVISRNARVGMILFAIYVVLYAGFIVLSAFKPETMSQLTPLGSVNVAIVYGVGLIVAALVLAAVYMAVCRKGGGTGEP